jgi:thiamine transport system ATP-binding protein
VAAGWAPSSVDAGAAASPALLELRGVRAGYGGDDVLRDIDLSVPEGQLLCVLGPSGSGKSTLLRVIAGLERPSAGRVSLAGRDLAGVPPHDRGIGLMFQDYALFPHRDVAGNVGFGLRMRGLERRAVEARVAELLELVGLPGMAHRPVAQLSGGEQQRVALARALAPRPRLLMLDEPMGSLDRSLRERLPEELRTIFVGLGLTVLYVTHDQDEALSVADRVVILGDGTIVADGPPEVLWTRPPSAWVAGFLGFRNVIPARRGPDGSLETPWGRLPGDTVPAAPGDDSLVTLVLRPDRLRPSPGGPIRGRIVSRRFAGDHVVLGVRAAEGALLHVESRWAPLPVVGDELELDVDPGGVHLIVGPGTLPSGP